MVARLKLKGIDGRAPPGVFIALAPKSRGRETRASGSLWRTATLSNCGDFLKLSVPSLDGNVKVAGVNRPG